MVGWNLQVILDKATAGERDLLRLACELMDGGASCIQLRDKLSCDRLFFEEAKDLRRLTKNRGCVLLINDRVDIAVATDADGVHLGQADLPYKEARSILGNDKIIGISTHNIEEALVAQMAGADYIGVGPIFPTKTRPDLDAVGLDIITLICQKIKIPAFFIGGINLENLSEVTKRGGGSVAIASAILNSADITKTTRTFIGVIGDVSPFSIPLRNNKL